MDARRRVNTGEDLTLSKVTAELRWIRLRAIKLMKQGKPRREAINQAVEEQMVRDEYMDEQRSA